MILPPRPLYLPEISTLDAALLWLFDRPAWVWLPAYAGVVVLCAAAIEALV